MNSVDIGLPQLAMHSSYETAGVRDTEYLVRAMRVFYSRSIEEKGQGSYILK
jgi:aspartyl aminopeptidase